MQYPHQDDRFAKVEQYLQVKQNHLGFQNLVGIWNFWSKIFPNAWQKVWQEAKMS